MPLQHMWKTNSSSKILMITACFVKFSKLVFKFCLQWKEHSHQYLVIYSDHLVSSFQSDLSQKTFNAPDNLAKFYTSQEVVSGNGYDQ